MWGSLVSVELRTGIEPSSEGSFGQQAMEGGPDLLQGHSIYHLNSFPFVWLSCQLLKSLCGFSHSIGTLHEYRRLIIRITLSSKPLQRKGGVI